MGGDAENTVPVAIVAIVVVAVVEVEIEEHGHGVRASLLRQNRKAGILFLGRKVVGRESAGELKI